MANIKSVIGSVTRPINNKVSPQTRHNVKKWAPLVGLELTGGYASNAAYAKWENRKRAKPQSKPYPTSKTHTLT